MNPMNPAIDTRTTTCPNCGGLGWTTPAVPQGHPHWGEAVRCPCQRAEDQRRMFARLQRYTDADPALLQRMTFAAWRSDRYPDVVSEMRLWSHNPTGWRVLVGRPGSGKSHLLVATAGELVARGRAVVYVLAPRLLSHLREAMNEKRSDRLRLEQLERVDVLLLDDYGLENATDWAYEQLHMLLDARYMAERPTVIASNLLLKDWPARLASRARDRALSQVFVMLDPDYRTTEERGRRTSGDTPTSHEGAR